MRVSRLYLLLMLACSSPSPIEDAGFSADAESDAGADDAGAPADASPPADTGSADAGEDGFGLIMGACGALDEALTSTSASVFGNSIDFGDDPYDSADESRLSEGGREILRDGNAGGSSLFSELFSYEVLHRCEGAVLLKTETEVEYVDPMGKLTDLLVSIDGHKIGVSVTRAVTFPRDAPYSEADALPLLESKLEDILASSANVAPEDRWVKQILHVIAYGEVHAEAMVNAHAMVDESIRADTILVVTRSDGDDEFIY
jgi:hypothetical protein